MYETRKWYVRIWNGAKAVNLHLCLFSEDRVIYVRRKSLSRYRVASVIHAYIIEVILHSCYLITLVTGASREKKKPRSYLRKSTDANHRAEILRQKFSQHASSVLGTLNICNLNNLVISLHVTNFQSDDQLFVYKKLYKMICYTMYI